MSNLVDPTTIPVIGPWIQRASNNESVNANLSGIAPLSATIIIEAANSKATNGALMGTITLSDTDVLSDGFITQNAVWQFWRARVTAISGTGASVQVVSGPKINTP